MADKVDLGFLYASSGYELKEVPIEELPKIEEETEPQFLEAGSPSGMSAPWDTKMQVPNVCCDCGLSHILEIEAHHGVRRISIVFHSAETMTDKVRAIVSKSIPTMIFPRNLVSSVLDPRKAKW